MAAAASGFAALPPLPPERERRGGWLAALRQAYLEAPDELQLWLPLAWQAHELDLTEQSQGAEADACSLDLVLLLCELLLQERRFDAVTRLLELALSWPVAADEQIAQAALLGLQCRMHWLFQRHGEALHCLARLTELTQHKAAPLAQAHQRRAFAQSLFAQREYRRAIELYHEAIALHRQAEPHGAWISMYSLIAAAQRSLGNSDAMLQAFRKNADEAAKQRRWWAASNACTGIAEEYAERGELALAEQALAEAQAFAERPSQRPLWLEKELWAVDAVCAALRQDHARAVAMMKRVIAHSDSSSWRDKSRRLRQLVPWQLRLGQAADAIATLEQAHALELEEAHEVDRKELASRLQRVELEHARAEQLRNAQHAAVLEARNQALERALAVQHELQTELIEASKLATLGHLLAGMSHELNTPLGVTLTAVSTVADLSRQLGSQIKQGSISRREFVQGLGQCENGAELARNNLERALELIATYRQLDSQPRHELWAQAQLDELIRSTWARSVDPRSALQLQVDADLRVPVHQEALCEILRQLFQNVERHAYPPGSSGQVLVQAQRLGETVSLSVTDQGRGIAPDFLPRIFDPYESTQFGQGRSGLGLFVARAAAVQGLEGKLRASSQPGLGCRFELSWPIGSLTRPA
ncbi:HAMP domain-containing sensor histidine kinase [Paucibacter sp. APW11]|uniref:histidine kinase n=1 Tax=Roseateles aquae TaxID=3077235 RepID=A0ABU3P9J5_9BURK|nr:HAMP domain-containing sensor histidine kinase [Paucibacter sp. APW11]MDT8999243.1 HAMP domain-containing sensor histidine kinase [Paucibacter sp. APW11]